MCQGSPASGQAGRGQSRAAVMLLAGPGGLTQLNSRRLCHCAAAHQSHGGAVKCCQPHVVQCRSGAAQLQRGSTAQRQRQRTSGRGWPARSRCAGCRHSGTAEQGEADRRVSRNELSESGSWKCAEHCQEATQLKNHKYASCMQQAEPGPVGPSVLQPRTWLKNASAAVR